MKFAYLASPYSHPDSIVRRRRYLSAMRCVAWCRRNLNMIVFSPIVYTHELGIRYNMPFDAATWQTMNDKIMSMSDEILVLQIKGWDVSVGVTAEIVYARNHGKALYSIIQFKRTYFLGTM